MWVCEIFLCLVHVLRYWKDKILSSAKSITDSGSERVCSGEDKKAIYQLLQAVFRSPTHELYEVFLWYPLKTFKRKSTRRNGSYFLPTHRVSWWKGTPIETSLPLLQASSLRTRLVNLVFKVWNKNLVSYQHECRQMFVSAFTRHIPDYGDPTTNQAESMIAVTIRSRPS